MDELWWVQRFKLCHSEQSQLHLCNLYLLLLFFSICLCLSSLSICLACLPCCLFSCNTPCTLIHTHTHIPTLSSFPDKVPCLGCHYNRFESPGLVANEETCCAQSHDSFFHSNRCMSYSTLRKVICTEGFSFKSPGVAEQILKTFLKINAPRHAWCSSYAVQSKRQAERLSLLKWQSEDSFL